MDKKFVEIAVNVPASVPGIYHYELPDKFDFLTKGCHVVIPFGNRTAEGIVVGFSSPPKLHNIKSVIDVPERNPVLPENLIELGIKMSQKYVVPLGQCLFNMLPPGIKIRPKQILSLKHTIADKTPAEEAVISLLIESGGELELSHAQDLLGKSILRAIKRLKDKGALELETAFKNVTRPLFKNCLYTTGKTYKTKSHHTEMVLKYISRNPGLTIKEVANGCDSTYTKTYSSVKTLLNRNVVKIKPVEIFRKAMPTIAKTRQTSLHPTPEQEYVLKLIKENIYSDNPKPVLLYGVTGSGKTEIYLQTIEDILKAGKTAIVLVPEISLTPQMVERFRGRFGDDVAVLHSHLSHGERYDEWRRIKRGEVSVAVGARSAIFAPLQNLGIIIIDEEHETSYKQEETPRYHSREIAEMRAEIEKAGVIFGSATPSTETYYRAQKGELVLGQMTKRVMDRPMPSIEIVDMRTELKSGNRSIFSRKLQEAIQKTLDDGQQIILFLNRRGYATFILCRECGYVLRCPRCDISLTYHHDTLKALCHYCGYETGAPDVCPKCGGRYIRYFGTGTQKVEKEARKLFPDTPIERMDADTTKQKDAHQKILNRFKNGNTRILIGTQMIAKGLDFPQVGLVGVITADTAINLPDFRAGERTFQLITQVAGRTGRGEHKGYVIVQTYAPEHYAIKTAKHHDYESFFEKEIGLRKEHGYPPFCSIINMVISGYNEGEVKSAAKFISDQLKDIPESILLGPVKAPISKINNRFRWQILIKTSDITSTLKQLNSVKTTGYRVEINTDPNPVYLL